MSEEEIEIIQKEIRANILASNCDLASDSDKEEWDKAVKAQTKLLQQYNQLKEVIEEVREYIKNKGSYVDSYDGQTIFYLGEENQIELLQILDKAKETIK